MTRDNDSSYTVLTQNHLLLGRSGNVLPDDAELRKKKKKDTSGIKCTLPLKNTNTI